MRCDQCHHWTSKEDDLAYGATGLGLGRCLKAERLWDATKWVREEGKTVLAPEDPNQMMFTQDGSDYMADLFTRPEFFCAHFQEQGASDGSAN